MLKEFKEFAMKGSIMDLAIGVVIGGAFQKIVNSLVNDIIMPAISILTGKVDFSDMVLTVGNVSIKYGNFITSIVDFLIIAFSIFLVIRYLNKLNEMKDAKEVKNLEEKFAKKIDKLDKKGRLKKFKKEKKEEVEKEPETKICPYCLTEIKYKATKCPHCTSELEVVETEIKEEDK
jgi:large conductance mechanosensitive channel